MDDDEPFEWEDGPVLQERMNMHCYEGREYLSRLRRMEECGYCSIDVHYRLVDLCGFWMEILPICSERDRQASVQRNIKRALHLLDKDE